MYPYVNKYWLKKQGSVYSQHQDSLKNDFKTCLLQAEKLFPYKGLDKSLGTICF